MENNAGNKSIEALKKAPAWFVKRVSENRVAMWGEEYALPFKGRANDDYRFSSRQKAINKIQEIKQNRKESPAERVKRLAALKKRAKR
jgi:hypothetical protein